MDINGWLTVITILLALLALMPKEDLKHLQMTSTSFERLSLSFLIICLIPYLILFKELTEIFPKLKKLTFIWGLDPQFLAFIVFYIFLGWLMLRLTWLKPKNTMNEKLLNYYKDLLYQKPFEEVFKFLLKNNDAESIRVNWSSFRTLFLDPKFLQQLAKNRQAAYFIVQFIELIEDEEDFKKVFSIFLENQESILFEELKQEPSAFSISEAPLLNVLIKNNLIQSVHLGMLGLIEDNAIKMLAGEGTFSSYNNPFRYPAETKLGHNMPIYFYLKLIDLIYEIAIVDRIKINEIRQTLFSNIVNKILDKMSFAGLDLRPENPSNYFWLLGSIFEIHSDWSRQLSKGEVNQTVSLNTYVNFSFHLCINLILSPKLYRRIPRHFIERIGYYYFFSIYFSHQTQEDYLEFMENEVISRLSTDALIVILNKTFDEEEAKDVNDFVAGRLSHIPRIKRLFDFLSEKGNLEILSNQLSEDEMERRSDEEMSKFNDQAEYPGK